MLPEHLYNATWPEMAMVKRISVLTTTTVLRGGQKKALKSHAMCFDAGESPLATLLPRKLNDTDIYKANFAGSLTKEQKIVNKFNDM